MQWQKSNEGVEPAWNNLPEQLRRHYQPYADALQQYGSLKDNQDEGLYLSATRILWLVPLVETLQQRQNLHHLYPLVHHAVIELKRQPHNIPQEEAFTFSAVAEGRF